jgi:hypothetical protein
VRQRVGAKRRPMTGSAKPGSATSRPGKAGQPQALLLLLVIASVAKQSISFFMPRDGLLRFARNDGRIRLRVLAAHCARGLRLKPCPLKLRAQGRPGARCTRGLACNCAQRTRTRAYRFSGNTPAFPAQWLYGLLRALPGERLFCHRRRRDTSRQLDASTAASGPHDFAVRFMRARLLRTSRPPHPTARS